MNRQGPGEHRPSQGSVHVLLAGLFALALGLSGCGPREDPTLNLVERALKAGNPAKAKQRLEKATRYPDDLVDALGTALDLTDANAISQLPAILSQADKANAAIQTLEARAATESLDDLSYRRLTALTGERSLVFSLLATRLAAQEPGALAQAADGVVQAGLVAHMTNDSATLDAVDTIFAKLGPAALTALSGSLTSEIPLIRAGAVRYIGRLGLAASVPALQSFIGVERDFIVLYELPLALGQIDAPEAGAALAQIVTLRDDGTYTVESAQARSEAIDQIRRKALRDTALIPVVQAPLLSRLADDNSYAVERARAALIALAVAGPRPSPIIDSLIALASAGWQTEPLPVVAMVDADREKARRLAIVVQAAITLIALREPTAMSDAQRQLLLQMLDSYLDIDDARAAASTALIGMGGYALPTLINRLSSEASTIRVAAARALGTIGDLRAVATLSEHMLEEPDAEVLVAMMGAIEAMRAREAIPALVTVLRSERGKDTRVQNAAITALGRVSDPRGYPNEMADASAAIRELAVSRGARESVRSNAIIALGKIKPQGIELDLRGLFLDEREPDLLRKNAAWTLGEIGAQQSVPAMEEILAIRREEQKDFLRQLKKLYKNEANLNARWQELGWQAGYRNFREVKPIASLIRSEVVHSLRKIKGADAAPLLAEVLEDDQRATVRQAAAFSLGELKKEPEALVRALKKDEVGAVRAEAATALGKIKTEQVVPALLETYRKDKYETTRVAASIGLREAKYASAVEGLADILEGNHLKKEEAESKTVRAEVVTALRLDGIMVAEPLRRVLGSTDPTVRGLAADIIGLVAGAVATDDLIELLSDSDPNVREKAAYALGRVNQRTAVEGLLARLQDEAEWFRVRAAAAWALGTIRDLSARPALTAALSSPNATLRAAATTALGAMRSTDALPEIVRLATDRAQPDNVRVAAIGALGTIDGDMADSTLGSLLTGEIGDTRIAVVNAASAAKVADAVPALMLALDDRGGTEPLRRAVASALGNLADPRAGSLMAQRLMDPTERKIGFVGADEHNLFWETLSYASRNFAMPNELLPILEERLDDPWDAIFVRRHVPHTLGRIADPRATEVLLKAAEHGDNEIALYAIRAIGMTRDPSHVTKLLDLLANAPTIERKREAATSLGDIDDDRAVEALVKVLSADGDEAFRNNCATSLGKLGATTQLVTALGIESLPIGTRISVLNALGTIGPAASSALSVVDAQRENVHGGVAYASWAARAGITGTDIGKS
ncbi:hypothetical protein FJZ36_05310 [Candidatus Poribacteria bacterium]|nr:hypothetical protein [Candidatus Poribacteria bacterium]